MDHRQKAFRQFCSMPASSLQVIGAVTSMQKWLQNAAPRSLSRMKPFLMMTMAPPQAWKLSCSTVRGTIRQVCSPLFALIFLARQNLVVSLAFLCALLVHKFIWQETAGKILGERAL